MKDRLLNKRMAEVAVGPALLTVKCPLFLIIVRVYAPDFLPALLTDNPGITVTALDLESGLKQRAIVVAENLPRDTRHFMEVCCYVGADGVENHGDGVLHIGKGARLVFSIVQAVAGSPSVVIVGHLQVVAGMNGEDPRPLNPAGVQCIG